MSKIFEQLYADYTAERRALGTPEKHDGFPLLALQSHSCTDSFNLVTAPPALINLELAKFIYRNESPLKIIYLPAINPPTGLGDPCGSLTYNLGKDREMFISQILNYYEQKHPEINRITEHFLRTGDVTHKHDGDECVLTIPRFQNGAGNETDAQWKKRTAEAAMYVRKLFSGVAAVANETFENGEVILTSKTPDLLKAKLEKIFGITPSASLAPHQDRPSLHQHPNLSAT